MRHARIWSGLVMVSALGVGLALPAAARDRCYDDGGDAAGGAVVGAVIGGAAAGPPGVVVGAAVGAAAGDDDTCRGYRSDYRYNDDDGQAYNDRYSDGYDREGRSSEYDRGFVDGYAAGTEDRGDRYYARAEDRPRGYNRHYRPVRETRTATYRDYRGY